MYYAAGIAHKFNYEFDSVKLVVIQPAFGMKTANPFRAQDNALRSFVSLKKAVKVAVSVSKTPRSTIEKQTRLGANGARQPCA